MTGLLQDEMVTHHNQSSLEIQETTVEDFQGKTIVYLYSARYFVRNDSW